jgi:signal transduction histidine kinase
VLQLYEDDRFLVEQLHALVVDAIDQDSLAIVAATPAHLGALERSLGTAGVDLAEQRSQGHYLPLDARSTLDRIMRNGTPDALLFTQTIGKAVARATEAGQKVSIYGELVALLWDEGNITAALGLEDLWNDLAGEHPFDLMCGYPMRAFEEGSGADAFPVVCEKHSGVSPSEAHSAEGAEDEHQLQIASLQQKLAVAKKERNRIRATQDQMAGALSELQELDKMRSEFIAMAVHDIQTPASVTRGLLEVLRDNWSALGPEVVEDVLSRAIRNSQQVSSLVTDILAAARLEAPTFSYEIQAVDLSAVITQNVAGSAALEGSLRFEIDLPKDPVWVKADPTRVTQILDNLLSNAARFSPPDGRVSVSVESADQVTIHVRDEGPGIASDDVSRLFQRFSRLKPRGYDHVKGTGLGLYVSKTLVEAQGGAIWVTSAPGEGSTFSFTLPACPSP